jgi:hypothetical protein
MSMAIDIGEPSFATSTKAREEEGRVLNATMASIMSTYFSQDSMTNWTDHQFDKMKRNVIAFENSIKTIFDPTQLPPPIDLPRVGSSIAPVQANILSSRLGHGQPRKDKQVLTSIEGVSAAGVSEVEDTRSNMTRPERIKQTRYRLTVARKRKRVNFRKLLRRKCAMCRDYNNLLPSEEAIQCKNCTYKVSADGNETGTLGVDGDFVNRHVEMLFEDSNEWIEGKLISYTASDEGEYPHSYTLQLNNNGRIIRGITFPDENIRFV